jgi:hypothetical protein
MTWLGLCFVTPEQAERVFGFSEFITAFGLLTLVYAASEPRARFRAATAILRLPSLIFYASAFIGFCTLFADVWFSQKLPVPRVLSNAVYWQAAFGALFVVLILAWIWITYIRPPRFSRLNAFNFVQALYTLLLEGDDESLTVVAGELARSARGIIAHAPERTRQQAGDGNEPKPKDTVMQGYARDVLLLIAHRKMCRHIVASSPGTAMAFFDEVSRQRKHGLPIHQFGVNISLEALLNKDSALYHEDAGFYSGFFGYAKPFTNSIYGDFHLVNALTDGSTPLDVPMWQHGGFDATQLKAYCRAVLTTFQDAIAKEAFGIESAALYRAFSTLQNSCSDLYMLNDDNVSPEKREDASRRVNVVMDFVGEAIKTLDQSGVQRTSLRQQGERYTWRRDQYDDVAKLVFELIGHASRVTTAEPVSWEVQHNSIWRRLFDSDASKTRKIIQLKLRRLLYEEIKDIKRFPNFKNARYLGYCLNISGLTLGPHKPADADHIFRKAVISWAKKNYLWMLEENAKVAKAVLIGRLSFELDKKQLVKTYEEGLREEALREVLDLDPPPKKEPAKDPKKEPAKEKNPADAAAPQQ